MSLISQEMRAIHGSLTSGPAKVPGRVFNVVEERKKLVSAINFGLVDEHELEVFDRKYPNP